MASQSGNQDIARRYASAFFALAEEQGQIDQVAADMQLVGSVADQGGDFTQFINNTTLRRQAQAGALTAVAKHLKLSPLSEKFLGLLAMKRRLDTLPAIVRAVQALVSEHRGEINAHVTSAQALDQKQLGEIAANLAKQLGKKVKIDLDVDPAIMGGLIIEVGSRRLDSSVRTKLERLHRALKTNDELSDKAKMREVA